MTQHQADGVSEAMLEAACEVAAWRSDEWIHADKLPEIYLAMRELDPVLADMRDLLQRALPLLEAHEKECGYPGPLRINGEIRAALSQPQAHPINDGEKTNG